MLTGTLLGHPDQQIRHVVKPPAPMGVSELEDEPPPDGEDGIVGVLSGLPSSKPPASTASFSQSSKSDIGSKHVGFIVLGYPLGQLP